MVQQPRLVSALLFVLLSAGLGAFHIARTPALIWDFTVPSLGAVQQTPPAMEVVFDYTATSGTAHSPALRTGPDGFSILWFDGTRESHEDVVIKQSHFTPSESGWTSSPPEEFLNKEALSQVTAPRQVIWSLGNTIQYGDDPDRALATIVSVGGWAAASIARIDLQEGRPTHAAKLSLSPFLNRSHLVRAPTISYRGGGIAIPAYFELGNSFGTLVRLDAQGRVRDTRRLSQGRFAIQPTIIPFDARSAVALMRNFDDATDRLVATWTADGGQSWTPATLLDVPNPNAPVAAVLLTSGALLMAFNDSPTDARILRLAVSHDQGRTWQVTRTFEPDGGNLRYPDMARLPDGNIVLTYSTGSKRGIRAHVFNDAWALGE